MKKSSTPQHNCRQDIRLVKLETLVEGLVSGINRLTAIMETQARSEERIAHVQQTLALMESRMLNAEKQINTQRWVPKLVLTIIGTAITAWFAFFSYRR